MLQRTSFTLSFLLAVLVLAAQPLKPLPHQLTEEEQEQMPAFIQESFNDGNKNTPPLLPPSTVRTMAEWEEVQALMITWTQFPGILTEIVRYAVDECLVLIVTNNPGSVSSQLTSAGISLDNVEFLPVGFNTVWMRDYGPWTVYINDVDSLAISDYVYNRPTRTLDDQIPEQTADYFDLAYFNADESPYRWIHTGGNHLRDGLTAAYSSDLVLQENSGITGREIAEYARIFFGVEDYRLLRRLPFDVIHHLDMHMRTLDEETIIFGEYPEGFADGPQIEKNIEFLRNHYLTPYGRPYKIIRQQMPPEGGTYPPFADYRTYTNGIFINNTFLVPIYEEQYDTTALRIYEEYLPGYRVVGIDCNDMIGSLGALHCITKLVGVNEPLRIAHPRIRDTYNTEDPYEVEGLVQHREGINSVTLYYRIAPELEYTSTSMIPGIIDDGMYYGSIPAQAAGTEVQYYIEAQASTGKVHRRPSPAPEGYYPFRVRAYQEAPAPRWVQRNQRVPQGTNILFTDDTENGATSWEWSFPGGDVTNINLVQRSVTYPDAGAFDVSLTATNPMGSNTKTVEGAVIVPQALELFSDDFSAGITDKWLVVNEDNDVTRWMWYEDTGCHEASLSVQNYSPDNEFTREYLYTSVSIPSEDQTLLEFDVAYAARNNSRWDEFRIQVIDQNGDINNVYNKGNSILSTVPNTGFPFVPNSCNNWRRETVDLQDWAGQNVIIEFESIGDHGNNLYLDNVDFRVNAIPSVSIMEPEDGAIFDVYDVVYDIPITVDAFDTDGVLPTIELYLNGELYHTFTFGEIPYTTTYLSNPGDVCWQARAVDNDGAESWSEEVCFTIRQISNLFEVEALPISLTVLPNPMTETGSLLIESNEFLPNVELALIDAKGAVLFEQTLDVQPGRQQYELNVKALPAGTYWVRLREGARVSTIEMVKVN